MRIHHLDCGPMRPLGGALMDGVSPGLVGRLTCHCLAIETDGEGRYRFRSILPSGYGCPPDGPTQHLLNLLGRHGQRPAHIHFFVEAPGFRKLTTQINIAGDEYLHDDFAFATRDGLIPDLVRHDDPGEIQARGLDAPFVTIRFDFALNREAADLPEAVVVREHAKAA